MFAIGSHRLEQPSTREHAMRHAFQPIAPLAVALACILGSAAAGAAPVAGAADAAAPAPAAGHAPPMLDPIEKGRRLFLKLNCYSCHGAFAGGGIGPGLAGATRDEVEFNVLNGNAGGMPSFAQFVDENNITNLALYLESIGTDKEPKFFDWWKKDPQK
jgi:mono/diheme cytochrome c family protein